jgi:hypothetical protein
MAISIEVTSFTQTGDDKFEATGTCDGSAFLARTIIYRNEPIFKVQEAGEDGEVSHQNMKDSTFGRGQRIAIARKLKQVRLEGDEIRAAREEFDSLDNLSVKELRVKCKDAGLEGYHAKGVRKADLVAMLAA